MIGSILMGASTLIGGAGKILAPLLSGVGSFAGQALSGAGSFAGEFLSGLPAISEAVEPAANLWLEIEKNRTAERIVGEQYSFAQQQLQAQKEVALQNALLSQQPVAIQPVIVSAEPTKPGQIIMPAQPKPTEKFDVKLLLIIGGILAMILFLKK